MFQPKSSPLQQWFHPAYLIALALLLLNDFYLKAAFGNWFTGKLSDFAGLFAFAWFFSTLFPKRIKAICWITAIGFLWWKSPFSTPFIEWTTTIGFPLVRVVDYTDLIAIIVLPVAYLLFQRPYPFVLRRAYPFAYFSLGSVAIFSFSATTMPTKMLMNPPLADIYYGYDIKLKAPKDTVMARLLRSDLPIQKIDTYENKLNYTAPAYYPGHRTFYINYDSLYVIDSLQIPLYYHVYYQAADSLMISDGQHNSGIIRNIHFTVGAKNEKRTIVHLVNANFNHEIDLQDWQLTKHYSELHANLIEETIKKIVLPE